MEGQSELTFDKLVDRIIVVDDSLRQQAAHAVNCLLTSRNWLIGYYIVEFEQNGADRAQYGEQLLKNLAKRIGRKGMEWRRLYEYRLFYSVYPQLKDEILSYFRGQRQNILNDRSLGSLTAMSYMLENDDSTILRPMVAISRESWMVSPSRLFSVEDATHPSPGCKPWAIDGHR